jgi:hypothetical protein
MKIFDLDAVTSDASPISELVTKLKAAPDQEATKIALDEFLNQGSMNEYHELAKAEARRFLANLAHYC